MNMIELFEDAFPLWWPGAILIIIFLVYQLIKLWSGDTNIKKHLSQNFVTLFAYTVFCLAVILAKQHVLEASHLLALALTALAATSFLTALYFDRFRAVLRSAGLILFVTAATASCANWLPQSKGGYPTPEVKLDVDNMTPQQLADEGEKIIFGGIRQSKVEGAIGKGQCPPCHAFYPDGPEYLEERAPNLWGITARKRLHDTSIEYIAESHVCPSCYVVGGFGGRGTENHRSVFRLMSLLLSTPGSFGVKEKFRLHQMKFEQCMKKSSRRMNGREGLGKTNRPINRPYYWLMDRSPLIRFSRKRCALSAIPSPASLAQLVPSVPSSQ